MTDPRAYVNDDGYIWVERRSAPWPYIHRAAMAMAALHNEPGWRWGVTYEGIRSDVLVTDMHEAPCIEQPCKCCRRIEAHQFFMVERDR